ncbi:MAG: long-chain fatty acid--CoA ligase [Thermoanaerobaculia bacterium]
MKDALPARTLLDYFDFAVNSGKPDLLRSKVRGTWVSVAADEFGRRTKGFALGLASLGVDRADRVAILSENRPEWPMSDFAILALGAMTVPIYTTYMAPQVEYILKDAEAKVMIVSNELELRKVMEVRDRCPALLHIVLIEGEIPNVEGVTSFESVVRRGEQLIAADRLAFDERLSSVDPEDYATMIYTSGTTGEPKGAVLTHANFVSNVKATSSLFEVSDATIALSFLPLAHVFERMVDYFFFSRAATIVYAESIDKLSENFGEVKPHCFAAVPRVYEKILARVQGALEQAPPMRRKIFDWATAVGKQRIVFTERNRPVPKLLAYKYRLADRLVFSKIKARLGGRFLFAISGGAPLARDVAEFFWGAGVEVYEGYGLTETSPVLACNRPGTWRLGTVGKPVADVQLKLGIDGEVLAKGPNIMGGYWRKPDETKKVFDAEGWFHTGDIGVMDSDGFLTLTDRKKEIIVNAYGKNIAPAPIEAALKMVRYVGTAVLIGDRRKFLSALIVPNFERIETWAAENRVEFRSREELIRNPKLRTLFQQTLDIVNGDEPSERRIRTFALLPNDLSIEGGELTPTLKVKRRIVAEKYKDLIDAMYERAEAHESVLETAEA